MSYPEESIYSDVARAVEKAQAKHAAMRNAHEAYAVLLEEVDEFWDEVKAQHQNPVAMRKELLHVAAMAVRAILDLDLDLEDPNLAAVENYVAALRTTKEGE